MRHLLLRPAACLALAIAPAACDVRVDQGGVSVELAEGKASDEWKGSYTLPAGGRLEIVNVNGAMFLTPSAGGRIEVLARREVRAQNDDAARKILQTIEIRDEVAPDRVRIETAAASDEGQRPFGRGSNSHVEYHVTVPPGLDVTLKTENGDITVENVDASVTTGSTNGSLIVRGLSGALKGSTVNGGVRVDLTSVTGDVNLTAVNGGIRFDLPADAGVELDARAVNGAVVVDEQLGLQDGQRDLHSVTGRLNRGGPRVTLQTTNGGVRVAVRGTEDAGPTLRGRGRR